MTEKSFTDLQKVLIALNTALNEVENESLVYARELLDNVLVEIGPEFGIYRKKKKFTER